MRFVTEDSQFGEPEKEFYCSVSTDGKILFTSPAMTDFLGYERDVLEGCDFTEIVHPNDKIQVNKQLTELGRQASELEFTAEFKAIDSYWLLNWKFELCGRMYTVVGSPVNDSAESLHQGNTNNVTSITSVQAQPLKQRPRVNG